MKISTASENHKAVKLRMLLLYVPIIEQALAAKIEELGVLLNKPESQETTTEILAICELITELRNAGKELAHRIDVQILS